MRVAYLNMSEPGSTCPIELQEYDYINIDHNVCDRPLGSASRGCDSLFFSPKGFNYRNVCGRVKAYQFGHPDAFLISIEDIDSYYVDGISITYGNNPRRHIWTYACGEDDYQAGSDDCPCNIGSSEVTPSFVGNNYYCESGPGSGKGLQKFFAEDPLWDGEQCHAIESPCCTTSNMPWFLNTLSRRRPLDEDIEVRVCGDEGSSFEGTRIDTIELYIK